MSSSDWTDIARMLRVGVKQLRAGMVLARHVPHPVSPRAYLLREGSALETRAIERLGGLGVREVWIRFPGLESLAEFVDPAFEGACREVASTLAGTFDAAMLQTPVDIEYHDCRRAVVGMLERLGDNPKAALYLGELGGSTSWAARHASSVCALSLLMGMRLESYIITQRTRLSTIRARDLAPLGVGAMFHDLGMMRLAPEVAARWEATGDERDPAWREHVHLGYELVRDQVEPVSAGIVLHHHQSFDGTGFPCIPALDGSCIPPAGSHIHVFARIVAAADAFHRLKDPPGGSRPAVSALAMLQRPPWSVRLDPTVLKTLLVVAPAYPPGSMVTLSDGRRAAVTSVSAEEPCRPTVRCIELDAPREGETIDLRTAVGLHIVESGGVDVAADNFALHPGRQKAA